MNTIEMIIMWLKTVYRIWKILLLNIQSWSIEGVLTRFWTFIYFKWQTHNILMELWHLFKKQVSVVTAELPHTCTIYFITDNLLILDYILLKTVWLYYNTNLIHSVHWSLVIDLTLKVKKKKKLQWQYPLILTSSTIIDLTLKEPKKKKKEIAVTISLLYPGWVIVQRNGFIGNKFILCLNPLHTHPELTCLAISPDDLTHRKSISNNLNLSHS